MNSMQEKFATFDMNNNNSKQNMSPKKPKFGIMFDIDGVLLRGKTPIPGAAEALKALMNEDETEYEVPAVFCTNGFGLREVKAATLSDKLGVKVNPDQIVMSQTPLEMFHEFHDKWCLVSGPEHDGGSKKVAESLGFTKIITIEDLREAYPYLDWVDRTRWPNQQMEDDDSFPTIEAIVMLGEPIRWETNLQLIIDVLVTQGKPNQPPCIEGPQLPVLAVNMDLQWMAKANIPRFGHGAFLVCLENLYKKICGRDLEYTALIGKPSEITYEYSQKLIEEIATGLNMPELDTVYAIGDNPLTDIYGANMFNLFLDKKRREIEKKKREFELINASPKVGRRSRSTSDAKVEPNHSSTDSHFSLHGDITNVRGIKRCTSVLVCTGVYKPELGDPNQTIGEDEVFQNSELEPSVSPVAPPQPKRRDSVIDHGHRDLPYTEEMTRADHTVFDVKRAIGKILELENWKY
uniref:haloacid dehalogenase-like hydrolase domain-containing 5 n=1 Tax=Ciona intestinalis TaxID=7719 RepID=UPI000044C565|nr:haloacid dehalogenase-like hydrolase domain-containing 5 [Ciona intestinalis]|eukprot:XP_002127458.1 haloacid dehalogenase-like hydrolase domain-containing 5 [Ciona intestinalis]